MGISVPADPYNFPYDGDLRAQNTAVIVVDMQNDFLHPQGYMAAMGYDISRMRAPIDPIRRVLESARKKNFLIVHTRQGCRTDLSDLPDPMRYRSKNGGAEIGSLGPLGRLLVRGEEGHQIISDLAPINGEPVIDKTGSGAFYGTDLELVLRKNEIRYLVLTGVTTDVCVHSTLRSAIDMGYDCLLLADCTSATFESNYLAAISMIKGEGGYFGTVCESQAFLEAIL